ncbi:unnamed protein product [Porites evermanni]|uniref:Uncharacterized protein n=1 Tax=Porites evermanni TaxID=104178 RepID=A0ABN8QGR6_9CNID|nr:unnamed protein product [Porites evermanni]
MADSNCNDGVNDSPSKVKTKACRFFHTKRGCKFGYECQFLHSAKTSSQSGNVVNEGDEFVTENEVKNFEPDINDDSEQRNERLGEDKEMKKHEDSSQDRKDVACKFFQRKRGCMRGSNCPFVHVLVDGQTNKSASDENVKSTRSRTKNTSKRKKLASPSSDKKQDESKLTKSSCLQLAKGDQKPIEQGDLPVQKENADNTRASQGSGVTVLTSNKSKKHVETRTEGMHSIKCNTAGVNTGAHCNEAVKGSGNNVVNHVKSKRQPEIIEKGKRMESKENNMRGPFNETNRAVFGTESTTGIPPLHQDTSIRGSVSEHGGSALKNGREIKREQCEKGLPLSQKNSATTSAVTRKRSPLQNKEYERPRDRNQTQNKDNCASNFRGSYTLADAMLSEPKKLRATEIQQLKRRFGGKGGFIEMKENSFYRIKFKPTDPDWQFKIEAIYVTVCFPDDYPLHMFDVALSKEQDLSEDIINFVNERLKQWTLEQEHMAKSQGFLKLFFRPFLHWLDKNLVSFFVDGGIQIGAKYVSNICGFNNKAFEVQSNSPMLEGQNTFTGCAPCEEYIDDIPAQIKTISDISEGLDIPHNDTEPPQSNEDIDHKKEIMDMETTSSRNSQECLENEQVAQSSQSDIHGSDSATSNTAERGTQIQFKGLNLEESISSIQGNKVVITFECKRCRQRIDLHLSPSGCTVKQCTRCASVFAATYRPAIIHQFSSILGYLDLDSCVPFDVVLPESELMLGCFQCSKETSVKGLQYGANWSWCGHCHHKLRFQIESTRFHQLQSSALDTSVSLRRNTVASSSSKSKKPSQSSGLKEGQPLPANGTCKHYKKSFRWLRFPCCGKCYPCDLCHEEEEDHEMKYATRMVCGFCSREQPYSQQPCSGCKAAVTKSRSAHWEGGKGCRDKISMSRNDNQKYSQAGKTTSRKSQKRSEGKGKGQKGK